MSILFKQCHDVHLEETHVLPDCEGHVSQVVLFAPSNLGSHPLLEPCYITWIRQFVQGPGEKGDWDVRNVVEWIGWWGALVVLLQVALHSVVVPHEVLSINQLSIVYEVAVASTRWHVGQIALNAVQVVD